MACIVVVNAYLLSWAGIPFESAVFSDMCGVNDRQLSNGLMG
jgi:hypothetical protein